ncbi:tetraacyldisaccharide 4'-kinase [Joostella sp. CR20]|uniref:tetraacyldisaccharide 4'-kinase n=1 Tax=Joostella sp. CR20 TaxID=2804312 RepID=UPI00313BEAD4
MRSWRKLLLPFSWVYGVVIIIRNYLFDIQVLKSVQYDFPVICIGNLSVGGTGKTPMTEYVAKTLLATYKTAILSRGYKRASKGFLLADEYTTVTELGDEPFQYHSKLKGVSVAVDEDRQHGISLLKQRVNPDVILLDDAFQHRKVKAGLNILLTMYNDLYVDDLLLPAGNLRDTKAQAKRASIIVVTKCPFNLSAEKQQQIIEKLHISKHQKVFFTGISYQEEVLSTSEKIQLESLKNRKFTLVTGVAHPEPLLKYLTEKGLLFEHLKYPDHHNFSDSEIKKLQEKAFVLTTEKDFVRLEKSLTNVFYLPIETVFLDQQNNAFNKLVLDFVAQKA